MSDQNLQDLLSIASSTVQVLGQAVQIGSDPGAKSLILSNDVGAVHLAVNPAAGTVTLNLPTVGGTFGLLTAISAGTTLVSIGQVVLSNSNGVSFGLNGSTITASVQAGAAAGIAAIAAGTQTQTSGTNVMSNSNGISFGMSNSSVITASADYVRSLSAGTTNATGNQIILSNSNGLSFGANGATLTATADYVRSISAGTTNATGNQLVFSNSNGLSFGANGATITAQMPSLRYWDNPRQAALVANAVTGSSNAINLSLQRISTPFQISATRLDMLGALTVSGTTAGSYTISAAIYTFAGSTASSASSSSIAYTFNSGTNSTAASIYGGHSGTRWRSMPTGTWNLTAGEYLLGVMISIAGVAGTTGSMTLYGGSSVSVIQDIGVTNGLSAYFADGMFSAGTGAFPSSIHLSAINQSGSGVLRQPYVRLIGTF